MINDNDGDEPRRIWETHSQIVVEVSSIVFEDFLADIGTWSEISVQLLEHLFTDLRKITIVYSYPKMLRHLISILNVVKKIYMH